MINILIKRQVCLNLQIAAETGWTHTHRKGQQIAILIFQWQQET